MEVKVIERPTGNLLFGVGYSTAERVILSGSVSQNNLFGTGNALSLQVNTGSVNTVYSLSFTNPVLSPTTGWAGRRPVQARRGLHLARSASYKTSTLGAGVRFGVPVTEYDTVNYGLALEQTEIRPSRTARSVTSIS